MRSYANAYLSISPCARSNIWQYFTSAGTRRPKWNSRVSSVLGWLSAGHCSGWGKRKTKRLEKKGANIFRETLSENAWSSWCSLKIGPWKAKKLSGTKNAIIDSGWGKHSTNICSSIKSKSTIVWRPCQLNDFTVLKTVLFVELKSFKNGSFDKRN